MSEQTTETMVVDVGAADDFVEGEPGIVEAGGRKIGIIRWRDEFFALRNVCPHQLGPLCKGHVMPKIVACHSEVGALGVDDDTLIVACPWHGWEFDVRTGRAAWGDVPARVRVYPVEVKDGRVCVDIRPRR